MLGGGLAELVWQPDRCVAHTSLAQSGWGVVALLILVFRVLPGADAGFGRGAKHGA